MRGKRSLITDQRGAVAFEMPFIYAFSMLSFRCQSTWPQRVSSGFRVRGVARVRSSIQYDPPPDVTSAATWTSTAPGRFQVSDFQFPADLRGHRSCVLRGEHREPQVLFLLTSALAPMILSSVLCSPSCAYTLSYSERFQ